jgi:uncharacterized protein (TIRG00374 family)
MADGNEKPVTGAEAEGRTDPDPRKEALKPASPLKRILQIGIPIAVSVALVFWILHSIEDPREVWEYMKKAAMWPLLLLIPISLVSHLLRAWRWRRFIGEPVSLFYSYTSVMLGYAVNDVLPRVGEVARLVNMNRMTRVPVAKLLTTLVAERLLDVIALVFCLGISFSIEGDLIAEHFPTLSQAGPATLVISLVGLAGLFAIACTTEWILRIYQKIANPIHPRLAEKGERLIRQGAEGLAFLKRPVQAVFVLLETAGIWFLYWIAFLVGLHAFGILHEIGHDGGTVSFSITVAGVLVPTVGAVGSYHALGQQALTNLYEMDPARALACITVIHAVLFYVVGFFLGLFIWMLQFWTGPEKKRRGVHFS